LVEGFKFFKQVPWQVDLEEGIDAFPKMLDVLNFLGHDEPVVLCLEKVIVLIVKVTVDSTEVPLQVIFLFDVVMVMMMTPLHVRLRE
jgi:hypothetical protein